MHLLRHVPFSVTVHKNCRSSRSSIAGRFQIKMWASMKHLVFSCSVLVGAMRASALLTVALPCIVHAQEDDTFNIDHFQVDGNTILPAAKIKALVAPFEGEKRNY